MAAWWIVWILILMATAINVVNVLYFGPRKELAYLAIVIALACVTVLVLMCRDTNE